MRNPLVSVIIPTYNRSTYLEQAIASVAGQTYKNIEIIVVDDGSLDNYAEDICNQFDNCVFFKKINGGLSSARNFGINKANGEYIAFLDDDDFWFMDKIERQVKVLKDNIHINLVHGSALVVDEKGFETGKMIGAIAGKEFKRSGNVFWNALGLWVVKSPTPLIRKSVFGPYLMFDESIKVGEDIDFYQRLFYYNKVYYIKEPLAYYRVYDDVNRLSKQKDKYIGIEKKMLANFKAMGVSNPIVRYRIAQILLKSAIKTWNLNFPRNKKNIDLIKYYFTPAQYLTKQFTLKRNSDS